MRKCMFYLPSIYLINEKRYGSWKVLQNQTLNLIVLVSDCTCSFLIVNCDFGTCLHQCKWF